MKNLIIRAIEFLKYNLNKFQQEKIYKYIKSRKCVNY